jgi:parvulin-like peptidyl-prolyl isomerase
VRAYHILQKHVGSRNPTDSYRNKQITRSLQEARTNIDNFRKQILSNPKPEEAFMEIAKKYSECRSAGENGDLGRFGRG